MQCQRHLLRANVLIESNEAFEEIHGIFHFTGTLVVYQRDNEVYHAVSKARYSTPSEIRVEHLSHNLLIPVSAYCPPWRPEFTRAPDPLPCNTHTKTPRLISYDGLHRGPQPNYIADSILDEVGVCEVLKRNPHSNIARYLGCQVSDDRITGICFAKYSSTLTETVNPGNYMKWQSRSVRRKGEDYSHLLRGVESDGVGRTYEWYDEDVQFATPQNDFDALDEIRAWLGDESKAFRFDE
ncbi:hypothetical protein G6O67_001527 [Ophiocordyceps sinensis]|uniref:Uncharacterized protein n=1 Tax=Ophiocordyceps sinensis TaxID=72228 RepID=A0A8H4PXS4_9HYPO|nr:hypothetical protein G6O67_001527 [Ophiocordyceps sinensis]